MMFALGITLASWGFWDIMMGSRQLVIVPVKMPSSARESSRRLVMRAPDGVFRLYMMPVAPATVGAYCHVLCSLSSCATSSLPGVVSNGMSESAKSTWFWM